MWALDGAQDPELLYFRLQRGPLHRQPGRRTGRAAQYPAGFAEGSEDVLTLGVGQGDRGARGRLAWYLRGLQIADVDVQFQAPGEDDRALDHVLQLANVSRPGIPHQGVHG